MFYRTLKTSSGYLSCGNFISGNPIYWNNKNDVYLVKTDFNGDTLFSHIFQTNPMNDGLDMVVDSSESIYIAIGVVPPSSHAQLLKTDSSGNQIFLKEYSGFDFHAPVKIIKADNSNLAMLCENVSVMSGLISHS